jgi:hypothetical protein
MGAIGKHAHIRRLISLSVGCILPRLFRHAHHPALSGFGPDLPCALCASSFFCFLANISLLILSQLKYIAEMFFVQEAFLADEWHFFNVFST